MRVALFTPMPPEKSGIADYSALLLPALRERAEVVVAKRGAKRPPRGADVAVYHIGNDPSSHGWIVDAFRKHPGVVVLHDVVLHHLVAGLTLARGDGRAYLDALEREGGLPARLLGHAVMENRIPPLWDTRAVDLPLLGSVIEPATAVIVHSAYARDRVRATGYARPVTVVPHPAWPVPAYEMENVDGGPLVGAFGNLNASKRIPQLLEAFAVIRRELPTARLLLVGGSSPGFDLDRRLERLGLDGEGIVATGRVDEERLWRLMMAADVHVNLRSPTMGETSGTVIRALSLGKPLVVSDVGWFAELPDEVAFKVPVDETEPHTLADGLRLLLSRPDVRAAMGERAFALARSEHDVGRVADRQLAAFELAAGGRSVDDAVLRSVSEAAAAVGIEPGSDEARELARRLSEVELGG